MQAQCFRFCPDAPRPPLQIPVLFLAVQSDYRRKTPILRALSGHFASQSVALQAPWQSLSELNPGVGSRSVSLRCLYFKSWSQPVPYQCSHPSPEKPGKLVFWTFFSGCSLSLLAVNILVPRSPEKCTQALRSLSCLFSVVITAPSIILLTHSSQGDSKTKLL